MRGSRGPGCDVVARGDPEREPRSLNPGSGSGSKVFRRTRTPSIESADPFARVGVATHIALCQLSWR